MLRRDGWCQVHDHIQVIVLDRRCRGFPIRLLASRWRHTLSLELARIGV
jgi:hypothetical protein